MYCVFYPYITILIIKNTVLIILKTYAFLCLFERIALFCNLYLSWNRDINFVNLIKPYSTHKNIISTFLMGKETSSNLINHWWRKECIKGRSLSYLSPSCLRVKIKCHPRNSYVTDENRKIHHRYVSSFFLPYFCIIYWVIIFIFK